jgi:RHS repeat-associated protein
VDGLVIGSGSLVPPPDELSEAMDCDLSFTTTASTEYDTWDVSDGMLAEYYYDIDSAQSGGIDDSNESCLQTFVESDSAETLKFYWKVSSEEDYDYLQFYIDDTLKDEISGEVDWTLKSYTVPAGTHILKWRYVKDGSDEDGDDCGWVDFVQWTGPSPQQDPAEWQEITYKHDVLGRRVEKKVDGYSTRYVHDGDHIIAEYDGNNNLLRKYIYGPCIDEPVCMIEVADSNAAYYYHYDALGSVVALSNSAGDTVQTYEYSVYGEVAVEDANHTNPYMFAGRRFDIEIGLYYNRARYYNPFTGRFLQADPIGYGDGMNMYAYCGNNPVGDIDPWGLTAASTIIEWHVANGGKWADYSSISVHWAVLLAHYALGGGDGVYFKGGAWGDLILDDKYMEASIYQYLVGGARHYMSQDEDTGTWNGPVPGLMFLSATFDVEESFVKRLLGGGSLYMDATWTKEYDCETGKVTLTVEAVFTYHDFTDLHPEKGLILDIAGTQAEIYWNYTRPNAIPMNLLLDTDAQPYELLIETDPVTIVLSWDPAEPGIIEIESGFPDPRS